MTSRPLSRRDGIKRSFQTSTWSPSFFKATRTRSTPCRRRSQKDRATLNKQQIAALEKDKATLLARIAATDKLLADIRGQLTEEQAKSLILKKLHDLAGEQLLRYLNAEKRMLISALDNLWDKYAVSNQML